MSRTYTSVSQHYKILTGDGTQNRGVLSSLENPANKQYKNDVSVLSDHHYLKENDNTKFKKFGLITHTVNQPMVDTYNIVINVVPTVLAKNMTMINPLSTNQKIDNDTTFAIEVIKLSYRKTIKREDRELTVVYRLKVQDQNKLQTLDTYKPYEALNMFELNQTQKSSIIKIIDNINLHDLILNDINRNSLNPTFDITNALKNSKREVIKMNKLLIQEMVFALSKIEIPIESYAILNEKLKEILKPEFFDTIKMQSTNLQLSDLLISARENKHNIPTVTDNISDLNIDSMYSDEQIAATTSSSPYTLIAAGAGTGKSTVITSRIDYLRLRGVNTSNILVLSFTNAAADNITARVPGINSMTIAKMITNIYKLNFPNQTLSTLETMVNTLSMDTLRYGKSDSTIKLIDDMIMLLEKVAINEKGANARFGIMIEKHFDQIVEILDEVKQTSLEIQLIICALKLNQLQVPEYAKSPYMIIDEVQDNSIYEFILALKMSLEYNQNLFIVGDAAQTLYRFRGADPDALNAIESSGLFKSLKLTTNYRSNQEILDYANKTLGNIESNRMAKIQLNSYVQSNKTVENFKSKVTIENIPLNNRNRLNRVLYNALERSDVNSYIKKCNAKNQQVAFLAYGSKQLEIIEKYLKETYPGKSINNMVPKKSFIVTTFTDFIRQYWNSMQSSSIEPEAIGRVLKSSIDSYINNNSKLSYDAKEASFATAQAWYDSDKGAIDAIAKAFENNTAQIWASIRALMIDYEVRNNAIRQKMLNHDNEDKKHESLNADFILSTIHSVKGLEYENVVILINDDYYIKEDEKRMYYVALTRATETEYIMNFNKSPLGDTYFAKNYTELIDSL